MSLDELTLKSFLSVVETGSFTKASEVVNRTQSAVSQQMSKLETFLGHTLFIRNKKLELTREGEVFYTYAKQINELQYSVIDRFKEPDLVGEIKIGFPEDFASVYLNEILVSFSRIHPRIKLTVDCDLTVNLIEKYKSNQYDLALVKSSAQELEADTINQWQEKLGWAGDTQSIKQDGVIPLILSPSPCVYRKSAVDALRTANKPFRFVFTSHSYSSAIDAAHAGLGVTVLPVNMISDKLKLISNRKILPDLPKTTISLLRKPRQLAALDSLTTHISRKLGH